MGHPSRERGFVAVAQMGGEKYRPVRPRRYSISCHIRSLGWRVPSSKWTAWEEGRSYDRAERGASCWHYLP